MCTMGAGENSQYKVTFRDIDLHQKWIKTTAHVRWCPKSLRMPSECSVMLAQHLAKHDKNTYHDLCHFVSSGQTNPNES